MVASLEWKRLVGLEESGTGDKDGGVGVHPDTLLSGVLVVLRGGGRGRVRSTSLSPDSAKLSTNRCDGGSPGKIKIIIINNSF